MDTLINIYSYGVSGVILFGLLVAVVCALAFGKHTVDAADRYLDSHPTPYDTEHRKRRRQAP